MTAGVVYIAAGDGFVAEATISAKSVKSVMPNIPITLITDKNPDSEYFDEIIPLDNPRNDGGDRVFNAEETPYEKTLYLDTDIYVAESVEDIFQLLDSFDVALCINQANYISDELEIAEITDLPDSFPEYNGGVIGYRKNPRTADFLSRWKDAYSRALECGQIHNQAALRYALYHSDVRIATMRNQYNCVYRRPGCVNGRVKVFHGRLCDIDSYGAEKAVDVDQAVTTLNSRTDLRIYDRVGDSVRYADPTLIERSMCSVRDRGLWDTIRRIPSQFDALAGIREKV